MPDARSGPRFLRWLGRNQLGGQFKALAWGLLHFVAVSGLPFCVGFAVQAVVDRSGTLTRPDRWAAGAVRRLHRAWRHHAAPRRGHQPDHRRRARPAAAGPQDRPVGFALRDVSRPARSSRSRPATSKIGWFVEALSRFAAAALTVAPVCAGLVVDQPALGVLVAVGVPVLALAVLPLLPLATRRADFQREKAGRATELASDTVAGLRGAARHRRRGTVPRPLPPRLPGGPPRGRAQRPDAVAESPAIQVLLPVC